VDYKATAKDEAVKALDKEWQDGYKRQMEVYQWLLRQNGLKVSDIGYFVYCTGKMDRKAFDKRIDFDVNLIAYKGNDSWVEKTLFEIKKCLDGKKIPKSGNDCDWCTYSKARNELEKYGQDLDKKGETIILTKTDTVDEKTIKDSIKKLSKYNKDILTVSILDDEAVKKLNDEIVKRLRK
jgi:hypothetical protein